MNKQIPAVIIRDYLDYRAFLRDRYKQIHTAKKNFNYQYLISLTGLKSAGHITQIFNGSRNIPERLIAPFASAFKLNRIDTEYFRNLVYYNQAKKHQDKDKYFKKLIAFHRKNKKLIDPKIYRYFSNWYNPIVRELVEVFLVTDDNIKECAKMIKPKISPSEMKQSLILLTDLGLIERSDAGIYKRIDSVISTGETWSSLTIHKYQRATMDLAKDALDNCPKDERDISTLTMSISGRQLPLIREKIKQVRKDLLNMAGEESTPDRIFQCNIQFFPVINRLGAMGENERK